MSSIQLIIRQDPNSTMGTCISQSFSEDDRFSIFGTESIEVLMEDEINNDLLKEQEEHDHHYKDDSCSISEEAAVEIQISADGIYCKSEKKNKVRFGFVETRTHDVTIGNHPFCIDGLPISLDWSYNPVTCVREVKTYDGCRKESTPRRLTYLERKLILNDTEIDRFYSLSSLSLLDEEELSIDDLDDLDSMEEHFPEQTSLSEHQETREQQPIEDILRIENDPYLLIRQAPEVTMNQFKRPFLISQTV